MSMKKIKVIGVVVVAFVVIIATLLHNKAKSSANQVNNIATVYSVTVATASMQQPSENISLVGVINANSDIAVISETQGRVVAVNANVGDYKPAGSVLVQVDDELKKANFVTAEVNYQKAKKDLARYESLYKDKSISDSHIEGARLAFKSAEAQYIVARKTLADTKITTPISGIVTMRNVEVGSMVMGAPQATLIANIVDITKLKVKLNVAEADVFRMKKGDAVEITTDVYPDIPFAGTITSISAKGDEAHTYPVEITIPNSATYPLKAGMFGRANFVTTAPTKSIFIPREAVLGSVKDAQVYVVENGIAKLRSIVTGTPLGTMIQVTKGIADGEVVVVNGQNNLKDNLAVTIIKK